MPGVLRSLNDARHSAGVAVAVALSVLLACAVVDARPRRVCGCAPAASGFARARLAGGAAAKADDSRACDAAVTEQPAAAA